MNCGYCGKEMGENCIEGGFCCENCRAAAEHEEKLRENEHMSILLRTLDDGGIAVQINLRAVDGAREMVHNYDTVGDALRGVASICTSVANDLKDGNEK